MDTYVFITGEGKYLKFWKGERSGFGIGMCWYYSLVKNINDATVNSYLPRKDWAGDDNPERFVVGKLKASEKVTRVVTLLPEGEV